VNGATRAVSLVDGIKEIEHFKAHNVRQ